MAAVLIQMVTGYGAVGAVVAAVFLVWGIGRIDAAARGTWAFRPLLIPGVVLLWPLVLWRWRQIAARALEPGDRHKPPRRLQDGGGLVFAVVILLLLAGAIGLRAGAGGTIGNQPLAAATEAGE